MIRIISIFIIGIVLLSYSEASAKKKECTLEEAIQAENEISTLKDWDSLHQSLMRFAHCADGASVSEGYSGVVGDLLADDWKHFARLNELCTKDKKFKQFVLQHIDETISVDVLQKIIDNTRLQCPSEAKALCREVENAASSGWEPEKK
jgi:hypothetical protein